MVYIECNTIQQVREENKSRLDRFEAEMAEIKTSLSRHVASAESGIAKLEERVGGLERNFEELTIIGTQVEL